MKKRKTPTEKIRGIPFPSFERSLVKVPLHEPELVSTYAFEFGAAQDPKKVADYLKRTGFKGKSYTDMHIHPRPYFREDGGEPPKYEARTRNNPKFRDPQTFPSFTDIRGFWESPQEKYHVITQRNPETGEIYGHLVFKKPKRDNSLYLKSLRELLKKSVAYEKKSCQLGKLRDLPKNQQVKEEKEKLEKELNFLKPYHNQALANHREVLFREIESEKRTKNLADYYGLKFKFLPTDPDENVRNYNALEGKVAAFVGIGSLLFSLLFLSQNITGNVILSNNPTTSNWIGGILFLVGIVGAFFWFKTK